MSSCMCELLIFFRDVRIRLISPHFGITVEVRVRLESGSVGSQPCIPTANTPGGFSC